MKKLLACALAGALVGTAAMAADTATFNVNVDVPSYCSFTAADYTVNLTYNPLNSGSSILTDSTDATFNCVKGTNFTITVGGSPYTAPLTRTVSNGGGDTIDYTLTITGDTTGTSTSVTTNYTINLEATLDTASNPDPEVGTYTDTVQLGFTY